MNEAARMMQPLPYIFRLNRALLEVDAVETDATLRSLLGERRQAILQDASGREVLCTVEPGGGAIFGRGLGRFFRRFAADLLGIVPLAPGQDEGGEPFRFRIVELPLLQPGRDGAAPPSESPDGPKVWGDLWERFRKGAFESESAAELHQASLRLSMTPGFDELISLDLLPFTPFAHQVRAVQHVLQRMRGRALLCDEVGLGKTIEAGIVLMEYMLRGLARRVLVLVPPSLVEQWTEELRTKFRLDFIAYDDPVFRQAANGWARFERVVASVDTAKREPHASAISSIDYDMVIVDEAHHLRNRETLAWKLVNRLRKRYILLLTATPVQNDLEELFNLITLLRPGQLRTPAEFRRRYVAKGDRLRPSNVEELRRLVREVMIRNRRAEAGLRLPPRQAETLRLRLSPAEQRLYDGVSRWVRHQYRMLLAGEAAGDGVRRAGVGAASVVLKVLQREAGSSPQALLRTLERMKEQAGPGGRPAPPEPLPTPTLPERPPVPLRPKPLRLPETQGGQIIQPRLFEQAGESWATGGAGAESTPQISALPDPDELTRLARSAGSGTKAQALVSLIERIEDKVVVFTGFRATQEALVDHLTRAGLEVVGYHGEMTRLQKEQAIREFAGRARVLVSTESGGEGRNLQEYCATMVNFDLPWNPMRIEQRIGRLHRIGQRRPVFIFNLAAEGTVESHLLELLSAKLNLFELVIGELDMILGNLAGEQEFEDRVFDIWGRADGEEELRRAFERLGEELTEARARYEAAVALEDALFGGSTEAQR